MKCIKRVVFIGLVGLLGLAVSVCGPSQDVSNSTHHTEPAVLALIEVPGSLSEVNLPIYAHLQDAQGKESVLVVAPISKLEKAGYVYSVLETSVRSAKNYLVATEQRPGAGFETGSTFNLLYNNGPTIVAKADPELIDRLTKSGYELMWLDEPMVVTEPYSVSISNKYNPTVADMVDQITENMVYEYTAGLTGIKSVPIGGSNYTITSRLTGSTSLSKATQYSHELMQSFGLTTSYHEWTSGSRKDRNVVGEIRGTSKPNEIVVIVGHYDAVSSSPGADDNGTGSTTVLSAAEVMSRYKFERTVRFLLVTGEEQGLYGSAAYARKCADAGEKIIAVHNMDMIGYNTGANDVRIATRPSSNPGSEGDRVIADTFEDVVKLYSLDMVVERRTSTGGGSDHTSFWNRGFSAVHMMEKEFNPYYHTANDKLQYLDMQYFTTNVKASMATVAHLAGPVGSELPAPTNLEAASTSKTQIDLGWQDNSREEEGFEIERRKDSDPWSRLATTAADTIHYRDASVSTGTYCYRARAFTKDQTSSWSNEACVTIHDGDTVFFDDFERDQGWTTTGGSATTGQWERGAPQETSYDGVIYQSAATTSGRNNLVTGANAGSSVGSHDVDSGDTIVRSPDITLPGRGTITLSLSYYLAHYNNATPDDYLRVSVMGTRSKTVLEVLGADATIQEAAWKTHTADLSEFAGLTIYLQIEAADSGTASLIEAAVDDVSISVEDGPQPPDAPSHLTATVDESGMIDLVWRDNSTNEDYFELERSVNSGRWELLASPQADETSYSDNRLEPGRYCYRIRAVVRGGVSSDWSNEECGSIPGGAVFKDDFESDQGWRIINGSAVTGAWERADPEETSYSNVIYQLGTTTSGSFNLVTGASAGSSVGSNDIDDGDTSIRSPDIVLPRKSGLMLSFQYYFAHYSNATAEDYLRVKVVGETTETVLEVLGTGSNQEARFQSFRAGLDAFAGQTVHLLIEAADAGSASLVEAAIDDVLIQ